MAPTHATSPPCTNDEATDNLYSDFFTSVGSKPNENHEKLLRLLPGAREASLIAAPASNVVNEVMATPNPQWRPPVHPLRQEWLDAADELDDIPLEKGEWLNAVEEELDEDGIPFVSAIARSCSGCILDAPGAVQVDNFTDITPETPALTSMLPSGQGESHYVPSALERKIKAPPTGSQPTAAVGPSFIGPIMTLEDEIRRKQMSKAAATASRTSNDNESDDSDSEAVKIEVIRHGAGHAQEKRGHDLFALLPDWGDGPPSESAAAKESPECPRSELASLSKPSFKTLTAPAGDNQPSSDTQQVATLPGECLNSDSGVEAQQLAVNNTAMLEHMGLGAPNEDSQSDDEVDMTDDRATDLQHKSSEGNGGVTFEAVEGFSLDPDFDYDNVTLTPREYPYNIMHRAKPAPFSQAKP